MNPEMNEIRARLKTPRAAAIAGIIFSVLMIGGLSLFRLSVPANPLESGAWLKTRSNSVTLALNLVPLAGIAFLWFIGVLRDRLGEHEDRFFATVFIGSGFLFIGMLFVSAAIAGGISISVRSKTRGTTRVGNVRVRPGRYLRDHESLRDEDGGRVHDHCVDAGDPHWFQPTLDRDPGLCVRAASGIQRALYYLDLAGLPAVGALNQYFYSD